MARFIAAFASGWLMLAAGTLLAADPPAAGTWKLTFPIEQQKITFLIMLSESPKEKGWVGDFLGASLPLRIEPTIDKVVVKDDDVSFNVLLGNAPFSFDGKMSKDGKKIRGSFAFGGNTFLVELLPSQLKNLEDKFALAKETLEQVDGGQEYFDAVFNVLGQATAKKMKLEDIRGLVDRAAKLSEGYGLRWQRNVAMKAASALADQELFASIALEQARQAERLLKTDDETSVQMQVLEALAATLKKAKKLDEIKTIEARLLKLEARDYTEYAKKYPPFKPEEYPGRKKKGDRAVLVELFTGAECPPCVAADLAFDALGSTYKPSEAVLLQYHLHFPAADPLTNQTTIERQQFYGQKVRGTPSIFFSGQADETGGGSANASKAKYASYREIVDEILEKPAGAKLQVAATQKGSDITIKANVSDLANPGDKISLRFALAEDRVRYHGGNGLRYHHHVVRAMPGGAKGVALTKKSSEHTASVNIDKLREDLVKYLDEAGKEEDFPNADRPLALKNLRVIAFIQDDATGEVLQAAQVDVDEK